MAVVNPHATLNIMFAVVNAPIVDYTEVDNRRGNLAIKPWLGQHYRIHFNNTPNSGNILGS
jgi:hypothetical protein